MLLILLLLNLLTEFKDNPNSVLAYSAGIHSEMTDQAGDTIASMLNDTTTRNTTCGCDEPPEDSWCIKHFPAVSECRARLTHWRNQSDKKKRLAPNNTGVLSEYRNMTIDGYFNNDTHLVTRYRALVRDNGFAFNTTNENDTNIRYVVFAPTDEAFDKLPDILKKNMSNVNQLLLALYHIHQVDWREPTGDESGRLAKMADKLHNGQTEAQQPARQKSEPTGKVRVETLFDGFDIVIDVSQGFGNVRINRNTRIVSVVVLKETLLVKIDRVLSPYGGCIGGFSTCSGIQSLASYLESL